MQEEDARVSSSHSPSTVAGDASFRSACAWSSSSSSSLASDVESDDDDDAAYPQTQCEYEEIPSFRWIASPLRWWKPKNNRKASDLSRKNAAHSPTATRLEKEPETPVGPRASEMNSRLVHFQGHRPFTLNELLTADAEVLGQNSTMYKATLGDGRQVAMRRLRLEAIAKDFEEHAKLLGRIRHPNLLAPIAYYYSPKASEVTLLMFDYMPNGNLSDFLHAPGNSTPIGWPERINIAVGVARGLHHLHTQEAMVHGSLSSATVLLDSDLNAKIGGYGLSELLTPAAANSNFMGLTSRSEYRAPELSNLNKISTKTDVYSLGVIMLELLTGKSPTGLQRTQWLASITKVETTEQTEFHDTLQLALKCVDVSPDERPEMQEVLLQLRHIKSKYEKTTHSPTTEGGNNSNDAVAAAASTITTASPTTAERTTSPFNGNGIQTPWTSNNFANDGDLLQPCISENVVSSPLAFSSEALHAPISSSQHKDENLAEMTPHDDIKDPAIPNPTQAEEIIQNPSVNEELDVEMTPHGDLIDPEDPKTTQGDEVTQNPSVDEELDALNPVQYITGVRTDAEKCRDMSQGTEARSLSSIDWANVDIQAHLHVPTSPPLVSSDPDSGYQRFFRTLYDLAHRSPPLPCNVLEVQLNNMIVGLHSLGYPLDTWVNAASLLLVLAKKKEHIEQHVDDYKVHVETQLKEFTSAITPAKEEITGTQSEITVLEQKQEELDDTIVKLKDQLAIVETQRQEVADSLAAARDVLAVAEGKMESISVRMNCLNQQYSAIPNLRRAMLLELPSLDEIFDSTFQEIMAKTF